MEHFFGTHCIAEVAFTMAVSSFIEPNVDDFGPCFGVFIGGIDMGGIFSWPIVMGMGMGMGEREAAIVVVVKVF